MTDDRFSCPRCGESIARAASVCRFCGQQIGQPLGTLEGRAPAPAGQTPATQAGRQIVVNVQRRPSRGVGWLLIFFALATAIGATLFQAKVAEANTTIEYGNCHLESDCNLATFGFVSNLGLIAAGVLLIVGILTLVRARAPRPGS